MPLLQGLIFDLDGTLIDSAPDLRQALNATLQEFGRRELSLDEVKRIVGDGMLPMLTRGLEATGGLPEGYNSYGAFQVFIAHYRTLKPDPSQIYEGAREMLEMFAMKDIKLGICTNKQAAASVRLLEELDLRRYFGFVAGGDTFPVHKPHPGHMKGVLEKLNVLATHSVNVGDSLNDVQAAHGASMPSIVVTHGYGSDGNGPGFAQLGAEKLIDGFAELPGALDELGFALP